MSFFDRIDATAHVAAAFPGGLAEGASLRTPCGARRVEFIRPGDMIVTRTNGLQPVRLVWKRTVPAAEARAMPALAPVVLKPRVLGPMMPQHDVTIAPDHRLLIPGWRVADWPDEANILVPARAIAGLCDGAYVDCAAGSIIYYQLVFDFPQIVTVDGLPVESLTPTAAVIGTLGLAMRESLMRRFPQLRRDPAAYPPAAYPAAGSVEFQTPMA